MSYRLIPPLDVPDPRETLNESEQVWVSRYEALKERGYLLRPRYRPGWVPTWHRDPSISPYVAEDGVSLFVSRMFGFYLSRANVLLGGQRHRRSPHLRRDDRSHQMSRLRQHGAANREVPELERAEARSTKLGSTSLGRCRRSNPRQGSARPSLSPPCI